MHYGHYRILAICSPLDTFTKTVMNFQATRLPVHLEKDRSTVSMTEDTILPGLLKNHCLPKGRFGYLVVEEGALQFLWEDATTPLDADPCHPIVIAPKRFHRVIITGPVRFRVEFYAVPDSEQPGPPLLHVD